MPYWEIDNHSLHYYRSAYVRGVQRVQLHPSIESIPFDFIFSCDKYNLDIYLKDNIFSKHIQYPKNLICAGQN